MANRENVVGSAAESSRRRIEVAGVLVDHVDERGAAETLQRFVTDGRSHQIVTVNADFVRIARHDAEYRALLNAADLAVADGMPIVWLSRLRGTPLPARIAGLELVEETCRIAAQAGIGVFLLGAADGVAEAAGRTLVSRHPGLRIAGTYAPPFGAWPADEVSRMADAIRAAGRCILFVAFGAPRQDRFIRSNLSALDVPIAMGVGCAFDLLAGDLRRAPRWMQRAGFEWVWRLGQEPARLWRRYLFEDGPLVLRLALTALRDGRRAAADAS
jgi:N-acetylglucosaminyldiphosphoundecaprenol N-acetyl-beta-D-mannosaminyltransferase